jgi:hypothetical protein
LVQDEKSFSPIWLSAQRQKYSAKSTGCQEKFLPRLPHYANLRVDFLSRIAYIVYIERADEPMSADPASPEKSS